MVKLYSIFFVFVSIFSYSQLKGLAFYENLENKLNNFQKNDEKAFIYISPYLNRAKKENNLTKMATGYRNALFFVAAPQNKLKYADSTIYTALKTNDPDLIAIAYLGKGIVYYSTFRNYKAALKEYQTANQYLKNSKDEYLKHKVLYQLGVIKSYLGYNTDAIENFNRCASYFKQQIENDFNPNALFNNKKGYLNSLHQLAICYASLETKAKVDSIVNIGLFVTHQQNDFLLERAYFKKCKGILEFQNENFATAQMDLGEAMKEISKVDDFAWLSVIYFYMGKNQLIQKNEKKAISYFKKVDSIYQERNFILPELVQNYRFLIDYFKNNNDKAEQIHYLEELIKVDQRINKDFHFLSLKVNKDFDRKSLIDEKNKLENKSKFNQYVGVTFIILFVILLSLYIRHIRNQKDIQRAYDELQVKLLNFEQDTSLNKQPTKSTKNVRSSISPDLLKEILLKLDNFEANNEYLHKNLTLAKLAVKFKTNHHYLSTIINEQKGKNFNQYISELRINYITQQLYSNKKFLSYSTQALADTCGMGSRNSFTSYFYEYNGIKIVDFVRKRKEELGIK